MALDVVGKFIEALPVLKGTSARGEWSKQEFIVETVEQYPKKVCIEAWTDKIAELATLQPGEMLTVSINLESREYNGRWFTSARVWRIQRGVATSAPAPTYVPNPAASAPASTPSAAAANGEPSFDDLPF